MPQSPDPAAARPAAARPPGPPARLLRAIWLHLRSGVRLYTQVMVGIPPSAGQQGGPGQEEGLPQPGHPERLAADLPLSPDERLWAAELAAGGNNGSRPAPRPAGSG
jgi:hypothetical protein